MQISMHTLSIRVLLLISLNWAFVPVRSAIALPITGGLATVAERSVTAIPALNDFIATVKNGQAKQVVGVYVAEVLALKVGQQPVKNPAYVTRTKGYVTQFSLAAFYDTIALLAHNDRSGALFSKLLVGQDVDIVYGDGTLQSYTVTTLRHFQALRPTDPYSNFLDLDNGNQKTLNADLFTQIYAVGDQVVFQTCIAAKGNASWGRLFVIATPNK
jgi:hypothetical protein